MLPYVVPSKSEVFRSGAAAGLGKGDTTGSPKRAVTGPLTRHVSEGPSGKLIGKGAYPRVAVTETITFEGLLGNVPSANTAIRQQPKGRKRTPVGFGERRKVASPAKPQDGLVPGSLTLKGVPATPPKYLDKLEVKPTQLRAPNASASASTAASAAAAAKSRLDSPGSTLRALTVEAVSSAGGGLAVHGLGPNGAPAAEGAQPASWRPPRPTLSRPLPPASAAESSVHHRQQMVAQAPLLPPPPLSCPESIGSTVQNTSATKLRPFAGENSPALVDRSRTPYRTRPVSAAAVRKVEEQIRRDALASSHGGMASVPASGPAPVRPINTANVARTNTGTYDLVDRSGPAASAQGAPMVLNLERLEESTLEVLELEVEALEKLDEAAAVDGAADGAAAAEDDEDKDAGDQGNDDDGDGSGESPDDGSSEAQPTAQDAANAAAVDVS